MKLIDRDMIMKLPIDTFKKKDLLNAIMCAFTVDAVPVVHGKWLRGAMKEPTRLLCTNCDWDGPDYVKWYSYCPNCGAKMECGE